MHQKFATDNTSKEMILRDKIFNYIILNEQGVNIRELEAVFGESRMRLGYIINKLLEEGKIRKSVNTYVSMSEPKK